MGNITHLAANGKQESSGAKGFGNLEKCFFLFSLFVLEVL